MQTIQGRCHCGNIAFSLTWPADRAEIPARACGCSFCLKHGGVWTSNPQGALDVTLRSVASSASATTGVSLTNTTGTFDVTGTGTTAGSGGVIASPGAEGRLPRPPSVGALIEARANMP